ncbi:Aste57867_11601 [Aphanomyces stellatus]|uniref:Aste57867_11601 protein n=1 Tax=Aphanomyces stellatus TaxID=120398 RepID=A0A485KTF0_9STRA|nr:hypothetical protein As57867_011558 [Aphanomyces stellatus]VFT88459.1 Aste57867_11601 [Aphanomyces stellatus]
MTQHTKLYDALGVTPDASPNDIDAAYLRHSIDASDLQKAQRAPLAATFAILSNSTHRRTYDLLGEDGVKLFHERDAFRPDKVVLTMTGLIATMVRGDYLDKCIGVALTAFVLGVLVVQPLLICLKVDHSLAWSWPLVMLPLWLVDSAYVANVAHAYLQQVMQDIRRQVYDMTSLVSFLLNPVKFVPVLFFTRHNLALVKAIFFVDFNVLVAMKLQGNGVTLGMHLVVCPFYILQAIIVLEATIVACKNSSTAPFLRSVLPNVLALALSVLVAFKLDNSLNDVSWPIVFTPVWIYILAVVATTSYDYVYIKSSDHRFASRNVVRYSTVATDLPANQGRPNLCHLTCVNLAVLAAFSPTILLAVRLQSGLPFTTLDLALPWCIAVGLAMGVGSVHGVGKAVPQDGDEETIALQKCAA